MSKIVPNHKKRYKKRDNEPTIAMFSNFAAKVLRKYTTNEQKEYLSELVCQKYQKSANKCTNITFVLIFLLKATRKL